MAGVDDIPTTPDESERPTTAESGELVWLEGGEERPFEGAETSQRPWLEVSMDWNAPSDANKQHDDDGDDEDDSLVWL